MTIKFSFALALLFMSSIASATSEVKCAQVISDGTIDGAKEAFDTAQGLLNATIYVLQKRNPKLQVSAPSIGSTPINVQRSPKASYVSLCVTVTD